MYEIVIMSRHYASAISHISILQYELNFLTWKREHARGIIKSVMLPHHHISNTANPRISPLGAYLFSIFLDGGLFEGGIYKGGAYKIIVDIKETLLKAMFI